MSALLQLQPRHWYAMQLIGVPQGAYAFPATPIFVSDVTPQKTGNGILEIDLTRAIHLPRPLHQKISLKVLSRTADVLFCETWTLGGKDLLDRPQTVAITPISIDWMRRQFPNLMQRFEAYTAWGGFGNDEGNEDVQTFLNHFVGADEHTIHAGMPPSNWLEAAKPMPDQSGLMPFQRTYEGLDAWGLLRATNPTDMDHRWLIYVAYDGFGADGLVRVCRSWTGQVQWEFRYAEENGVLMTHSAKVNLDPEQRAFGSPEVEAARLDAVLSSELFGRFMPDPLISVSEDHVQRAIESWKMLDATIGNS